MNQWMRGCIDYDDTCIGKTVVRVDLLMLLCDGHYESRIASRLRKEERELPWAKHNWNRCKAVKEPNPSGHWGRCELTKQHLTDHALERGFDILRWSTKWT